MRGIAKVNKAGLVKHEEAAGEVTGPTAAGLVKLGAELLGGSTRQRVKRDAERERLVLVEQVEGEDLAIAIGAGREGDGGGAVEGGLADERAGVVGDAAHHVEPARGARDAKRRADTLLKLLCQPHEIQGFIQFPQGVRVLGINTQVRHSVVGGQYGRTRCAAFMGHKIILAKMEEMGGAAGLRMVADPTGGYLANLPLDDYKKYFRPFLPTTINGADFLAQFGPTIDTATSVDPQTDYPVQSATDHHVHEAQRVRNFVQFLETAAAMPPNTAERSRVLDKAGHLMYGSHVSYTRDAMLGADEADLLVDLVRKHERGGLYGAKITGGGCGGTVAVLANRSPEADAAIATIVQTYQQQTGKTAEIFWGTSPGAWDVGTELVSLGQ